MKKIFILLAFTILLSCKKERLEDYGYLNSFSFIESSIILNGPETIAVPYGLSVKRVKAGRYIGERDTVIIFKNDTTYRGFVNDPNFGLGNLNVDTI